MQVVLVMFRTGGERRSFSMTRDMTVIGRREDCDFRIPLGEISRKHCRLIKEDGVLRAEDLGSSNGTYINGIRIQEGVLAPGDTLKVGSVVFVVQIDGVPADAELNPAAEAHSDSSVDLAEHSSAGERNASATVDEDLLITDDAPADLLSEPYDPMSILSEDPESSSAGAHATDDEIADDIMMDLESQKQHDRP